MFHSPGASLELTWHWISVLNRPFLKQDTRPGNTVSKHLVCWAGGRFRLSGIVGNEAHNASLSRSFRGESSGYYSTNRDIDHKCLVNFIESDGYIHIYDIRPKQYTILLAYVHHASTLRSLCPVVFSLTEDRSLVARHPVEH